MAQLYCIKCSEKIEYCGKGEHVCPKCGYVSCFDSVSTNMLDLHAKAQWYQIDGQYFNALQMYEIIGREEENSYSVFFGSLLAEFGVRYVDMHDGSYRLVCDRTQTHSVYDSEYYTGLRECAPDEVMAILSPVIELVEAEQKKNREQYLASAPVDEQKDYRAEARMEDPDSDYAEDYLSAREKYLAREREEQEEAERRRLEEKEKEEAARKARENRAAIARKKAKRIKIAVASLVGVAVILLAVILTVLVIIPAARLSSAKSAIAEGRYDEAAELLRDAGSFGESELLLSKYRLYGLSAGDSVKFGSYEQNAINGDGKETIEWIVLESNDNTVTLISSRVLDCVMYHENKNAPAYWESASLRAWLNGEFADTAFSPIEREMLVTVHNENPDNDRCGTKGGNATDDIVYLLTIDEAQRLLRDEQLIGVPSAYALKRGVYNKGENPGTYWWLRSPGSNQNSAAKVNGDGTVDFRGSGVNYSSYGVRPVITVTKAPIN